MGALVAITIGLTILGIITWRWVEGIDHMIKNHADYKGEDWLNWDEEDKTTIL